MPSLRLPSIYQSRRRKFIADLHQAHAELGQARTSLPERVGTLVAVTVRTEVFLRDSGLHGTPGLPDDAEEAVETLLRLKNRVRAVSRQIRSPRCWFSEGPLGASVWETLGGRSWEDIWRLTDDRRLPLPAVLQLLAVVRDTPQVLPTNEQLGKWTMNFSVERWWRLLRRRRRRLLCLLTTAAEREEELRWDLRW